ncbi:D-alanyl-D-alanine carboxypeptidase family protein [Paenibacillus taichungensis]|uniref:D-alanyl-D-alanine carboxypeptidase family protein n=1 Tax=Paenibacillus taichungensis TaxID=484184 RepID=UPI0038D06753
MKVSLMKKKMKNHLLKKCLMSMTIANIILNALVVPTLFAAGNDLMLKESINSTTTHIEKKVQIPSVDSLGLNVKAAILMEVSTGEILLNVNSDEARRPASMVKMMTEYIVADQIKQGEFAWDDVVVVNKNAAKSIGSRIYLDEGDTHTVKELYIAMSIGSANDATVALAEYVAGSEENFVKMMNEEAQRMGMQNTYFINSTGLDRADMPADYQPIEERETMMSARDAAILCRRIIQDMPEYKEFTTIQSYKFRTYDKDSIINSNWMLEANKNIASFKSYAYEGLDGMKTGRTTKAGNNFTGTAERNGLRFISVVMGTDSESARFRQTQKVLDYGFNNFEVKQVINANNKVTNWEAISLKKGKKTTVSTVIDKSVSFVVPKGTKDLDITFKVNMFSDDQRVAPIMKGTTIGTVTYTYDMEGMDTQERTVNLITAEEAEKGGWFRLLCRAVKLFFADFFYSVKNLF